MSLLKARENDSKAPGVTVERLHEVLRDLAIELERGRHHELEVRPGSLLDKDLGIDSLARVELSLRIERAFGVRLPEPALMEAETAADLFAALCAAKPETVPSVEPTTAEPVTGEARPAPSAASTLVDVLEYHVDRHADRTSIRWLATPEREEAITYRALWDGAQDIAAGLRSRGLTQGQAVALMLPTSRDYFEAFFGVLLAGCVPTPIYPPFRRTQIEDHLRRQAGILHNARTPVLITMPEARLSAQVIRALVADLRHVVTVEDLRIGGGPARPTLAAGDVALLQYTSGSTGDPKGVVLTHANLLANIRAIGRVLSATPDDVVVSWLPLYHDMGLIGTWLGSLYHACPLVVMSPLQFIARPERWLWTIHRYRGTLSAGPNFGYDICVRKIAERRIDGLDLSSWRMAGNGAEAINPHTISEFCERFARYGFDPRAMTPMYGLAESAVALTVTPVGRGPRIDRIDREILGRSGDAVAAGAGEAPAAEIVCCGVPIPGHEIRIVDEAERELAERQEGRIEFRGPSATPGYLRNPAKTAGLIRDGWHDTGDLGYIAEGELYVTGRVKDIIVRAGHNIYPEELEAAIGEIEGVRQGRVAVFGHEDPRTGTEGLVVLAETRKRGAADRQAIRRRIRETTTAMTDLPPDDIVLAQAGTILKTASGKIRRAACSELYRTGRVDRPPPALWLQAVGLLRASIGPEMRRYRRAVLAFGYAAWFWTVYRVMAPVVWIGVLALPAVRARRRLLRGAARLMLRLIGAGPRVYGADNLPAEGAHVIAANHTSFLDSLALCAVLPPSIAFVAKRELTEERIAGPFLRRIGTAFVERFDPAEGLADTDRLIRSLRAGESLVFYPEGTFDRMPGLRAFHMGAFMAAAQAGVPVVPTAIRGTRSILRAESSFPRRMTITITFSPPVSPGGTGWNNALRVKNEVREAILAGCGEPDLVYEPKPI